ncbi:MAG TPA: PaaI family thioesterase [Acidimicrobiales bacterium]
MELTDLLATMPFSQALGMTFLSADAAEVRATLPWDECRTTLGGVLHGGALMTLADSCGAVCAFLNLPEGAVGTSTIESKTNLFRGVRSGEVTASTTPLHAGRTTIAVQTEVRDGHGRLVSLTIQTQAVLS